MHMGGLAAISRDNVPANFHLQHMQRRAKAGLEQIVKDLRLLLGRVVNKIPRCCATTTDGTDAIECLSQSSAVDSYGSRRRWSWCQMAFKATRTALRKGKCADRLLRCVDDPLLTYCSITVVDSNLRLEHTHIKLCKEERWLHTSGPTPPPWRSRHADRLCAILAKRFPLIRSH